MASPLRYVAALAVLSSLANAKVYQMPKATTSFNLPLHQFNPEPTEAPSYAELRRRQATGTTVLVAPDNTCGYISGRAGAAYTCGNSATCIFFTASQNNPGRVACCDTEDCGARRTCYDAEQVSTSSLCDGGCLVDRFTLKCTNTVRPYCNTISFADNIFDYWCNTVDNSTPQAASTTYAGQSARNFSPLALTGGTTSTTSIRSVGSTSTTTTTTDPVTPDPDPPSPVPEKSSTPIGAIVGGVVGGLALIALVALGIWFLIRKKKQTPKGQNPAMSQPQMNYAQPPQQGSPPPNVATTNTYSYYDPKFAGQNGYPQSFGGTPPPPPQGEHQQPYYAGNMVPDRADTTSPGAVGPPLYILLDLVL
ncbi:uncharacterized protein ColSpa_10139 [Colletotrichum spaethianum]|uniref:Uncharacterized protein n=1 Tax=Colletotrichum spaethianum TaxID=700344 RepID=A0AA37PCW1_9PEZI|nr:uncharacterized protein ColSpa_10139 [Colletotrichum spaethianum]GKT49958.1 hypothetical protein ColSpa_10139 [Colletotrichum spaethianum]